MPARARITQVTGSDHEDFAIKMAAIDSDSDQDNNNKSHLIPAPGPSSLETYIPQEPGPHATDDELREVSISLFL